MLELFRVLLATLLAMHGLLHLLWFLAAWTSVRTGMGDGAWVLPGNVTIRSPIGKALGVVAVVAAGVFVVAALGLLLNQVWWAGWAQVGVFLSWAAVAPWLRQSPRSSATTVIIADLVLMFVLALELSLEVTA
jgi:hypothetical protein